jgi:hypothetical protein
MTRSLLLAALLAGCSDYSFKSPTDGGSGGADTGDAVETDTAATDSGNDSGSGEDEVPDTGAPDTGTPDTGTPDTAPPDTGTPDTGPPDTATPDTGRPDIDLPDTDFPDQPGEDDDLCSKAARTAGYLDSFQTPGDGKVLYCHRGGGPHYVLVDTDISACLPHLDHVNDVFPSTLCDS